MLTVCVVSPSVSVQHTLEAILTAAGHHIAEATDANALTLTHNAESSSLHLQQADATELLCLGCPVRPSQLVHRLQHMQLHAPLVLAHGWALDVAGRCLTHTQHPSQPLTEKEVALLSALAKASPTGLEREALLAQVWGMSEGVDTHTLETHIYRLRHKLAALSPSPCELHTIAGAYQLEIPG